MEKQLFFPPMMIKRVITVSLRLLYHNTNRYKEESGVPALLFSFSTGNETGFHFVHIENPLQKGPFAWSYAYIYYGKSCFGRYPF